MALYLKYRPKDFNSLVGQDFVKETLKKAVLLDKTIGAYLFCGPRGTGKTSTARIFAKAINCENPNKGNPCDKCKICKSINSESLIDIIEIDAASNTGVDNIRDLIEKAQYKPTSAKYKVYIIDEVHMLSKGAFNALLKILEEPPKFLKFILATTETHKVPETIISRCQRYDFKNISLEDIKNRLKFIAKEEKVKIDNKSLNYISDSASGGLRNAISLFEQLIKDSEIKYEDIIQTLGIVENEILEKFYKKLINNQNDIVEDFDELINNGKNIKLFFKQLIFFIKNKTIIELKTNNDISQHISILDILDETYSKTKNSLDENTTFLIGILRILNPKPSINQSLEDGIVKKNETIPVKKINENEIIDKCPAYGNIDDEIKEKIDLNDVGDIFGESTKKENNIKQEAGEQQLNNNFDKNKFLEELKKSGVKGLLITSLKQSEIKLIGNNLEIKFKTNFVKTQFNKEENLLAVKNILESMGFSNCNLKLI